MPASESEWSLSQMSSSAQTMQDLGFSFLLVVAKRGAKVKEADDLEWAENQDSTLRRETRNLCYFDNYFLLFGPRRA